jgi:hypothetical protein
MRRGKGSGRRLPRVKIEEITPNSAFKSYLMDFYHKIT